MDRRLLWLVAAAVVAGLLLVRPRTGPESIDVQSTEPRPADGDRSRRGPSRRDPAATEGSVQPSPATPVLDEKTPPSEASAAPAASAAPSPLGVDADGNFYPVSQTIDLIESQMANQPGGRGLTVVRSEIAAALEPPAEQQALEFLDRYLAYRNRGLELGLTGEFEVDVQPRFAQLRSLRREFFGLDVAQRLFGEEEYANNIAIREAEILGGDMSEEEKAAALVELRKPPVYRNE